MTSTSGDLPSEIAAGYGPFNANIVGVAGLPRGPGLFFAQLDADSSSATSSSES